jgi:DeoR/GlpR family transcriptional regulator of sugar metabolism
MIEPGAIVGLNGGTTTTEVARALALRGDLQGSYNPAITVVTNSLNIATELAVRAHLKIVVTGGVARPQSYELIGPLATGILEQLSLDLAVLGVDAIDIDGGAMTHQESEAAINQLMASRGRKVVVVADSSKLGHRAFARLCPLESIDVLVTDTDATDEHIRGFVEAGVEVIRA